jgi:hypothetical protein
MQALLDRMASGGRGGTQFPTRGQWWGPDPDSLTLRGNQSQVSTYNPFYAPPAIPSLPGFAPSFDSKIKKEDTSYGQGGQGFGYTPAPDRFLGGPYQSASLRSAAKSVGSAARDTQRALSDFGYSIRDRTSSKGFVPGMQPMFDAMRQAAADAGLSRLEMVAGKGQGHLSHAHGTEADIVGYNADGSKWSKAQRVAVAKGAATAGGNRFGFYSGPTLHVGLGYQGSPHNVVWNNQLRGQPGVTTFAPEERDFVNALRAGQLSKYAAPVASAYSATAKYQPPAQQAITAQTTTPTARIPQARPANPYVNSTGGAFTSDRQDLGTGVVSPLSMNTRNMRVPTATIPASQVAPVGANPTAFNRPAIQTPYLNQPYTTTLGGANAIVQPAQAARIPQARPVDATPVRSRSEVADVQRQLNSRGAHLKVDGIVGPLTMAAADEFSSVPAPTRLQWSGLQQPYPTQAQVPAARIPQARQPMASNWSSLQSPYLNSTGGTNALTARMPQPRPAYPPPSVATAEPTMYQQMVDQARRYAAVVGQVADRAANAYSQGMRSGMGYSGGGGYSGGSYGGAGGRSISSGVGGAFRNR